MGVSRVQGVGLIIVNISVDTVVTATIGVRWCSLPVSIVADHNTKC